MAELQCRSGKTLSELIDERIAKYPASGEINRQLAQPATVLHAIEAAYAPTALAVSHVDGLSVEYADWRFNLRMSNTEPLIRLNVESKGDQALMEAKTQELLEKIDTLSVT